MRIGKFMKFILISAYRKTVEKVDLNGFIIPIPEKRKEGTDAIYYTYLFKAEVLYLYFGLERGHKRASCDYRAIYKDTPEYRKALVQYTHARNKLLEYGLITSWDNPYTDGWKSAIKLTEEGKAVAATQIAKS